MFLAASSPGHAVTVQGLYEATVPVSERSDAALGAAFAEALRVVLVRVSGSRVAPDRVAGGLGSARRYVQRFGLEPEGRLNVGFDAASVDRLLAESGLPVWGRERPATLMLLTVEDATGQRAWVEPGAAQGGLDVLESVAGERGIPLVWPLLDLQERVRLESLASSGDLEQELADAAARYKVDAVLYGRAYGDIAADPAVEPAVDWLFYFDGRTSRLRSGLPAGVDLAADTFAGVFAGSASVASDVRLDVQGIDGLDAYAAAMRYLEDLTLVQAVAVEELAGDTLRLRLTLRGDAGIFERTLALDARLLPQSSPAPSGRLVYRYSP